LRLWAISDLHVAFRENREFVEQISDHGDDWLILAGDICESFGDLESVFRLMSERFAKVFWVPGNHELWTTRPTEPSGVARYEALIALCRRYGVVSPEDPYEVWPGPGGAHLIAPLFVLYDYSFKPADVSLDKALDWACDQGVLCSDEALLHAAPYASKSDWCAARCALSEQRLEQAAQRAPLILINHFPMIRAVADVPAFPPFVIWCGTSRTHDWHRRFRAVVVVSGHLHIPSTRHIDGVRFEEVSMGYPNQWRRRSGGIDAMLRQILPAPVDPSGDRNRMQTD